MSKLKAFLSRIFQSNWTYHDNMSVRVHKLTGKVEYWNFDDFGGWWDSEPMFPGMPLWSTQ